MIVAPNATLTAIQGAGFTPDYDTPAASDTARWEGAALARYHEQTVLLRSGQRSDELNRASIVMERELGELVEIGDTVVFTWRGQPLSRQARDLRPNGITDTMRVWLEDA